MQAGFTKAVPMFGLSLLVWKSGLRSCHCRNAITASSSLRALFSTSSSAPDLETEKSGKIKKSPVYTRTGDKGSSMLFNGERRSKCDPTFCVLGDQDELNASIGIAREYCQKAGNGLEEKLIEIQCRLFDLGAAVATPENSSEDKIARTKFESSHTKVLEKWIDELDSKLPPLKNFVIPSGGFSSVQLQLSRSICRRAERSLVMLAQDNNIDNEIGKYLNRLSDFLFVAARFAAQHDKAGEIIWRK